MTLPKILHRIWLGKSRMPEAFRQYGESWRFHHPDWDHKLWTDDNLPPLRNETEFYSSRSLADAANVLRYELLQQYGGLYVDTDFECIRSLAKMVSNDVCFVARQTDGLVNNAIIGAVPDHPFLKDLVASLPAHIAIHGNQSPSVWRSGPFYFTEVLGRHPDVHIYPPKFFYPYQWHEGWRRNEVFPEAYAVHHWTLSGRSADRPQMSSWGDPSCSCMVVMLVLDLPLDECVLEWVLEGYCAQTVCNFDVLLVAPGSFDRFSAHITKLDGRLKMRHAMSSEVAGLLKSVELARLPILIASGNGIPGPNLILHSLRALQHRAFSKPLIALYPREKMYPFPKGRALDLAALYRHSTVSDRVLGLDGAASQDTSVLGFALAGAAANRFELAPILERVYVSDLKALPRLINDLRPCLIEDTAAIIAVPLAGNS